MNQRTSPDLARVIVAPDLPICEAMAQLDAAGTGALLLCEADGKLVGSMTDGDIRRAILRGDPLTGPCSTIASLKPHTIEEPYTRAAALQYMVAVDINHLPVVDGAGRVQAFLMRRDLAPEEGLGISAVVMAGGFGMRLRPLTQTVPKPMLPIGNSPLLERTILQLRNGGIHDINLTTYYLPDTIIDHFGDGRKFGVQISYHQETHPRGTAGGLRGLKPASDTLLVMNGDILTSVPFQALVAFHRFHHADMTIGVRSYDIDVPYGVVECDGIDVVGLREKPKLNFFINAGTYLLNTKMLEFIPEGQRFDMTDLIQVLLQGGLKLVTFPIREYWLDIGCPEDYDKAQEDARTGRI